MEHKKNRHSWRSSGAMAILLTSLRTVFALITQKVVTMWFGPAGLAQIGQFQTMWIIFQSVAAGGGQDGLVKLTAEYENSERKSSAHKPFIAFAAFTLASGSISGLVFFTAAPWMIGALEFPSTWLAPLRYSALLLSFCGPCLCLQSLFMGTGAWKPLLLFQGTVSLLPLIILAALHYSPFDTLSLAPVAFSLPPLLAIANVSLLYFRKTKPYLTSKIINIEAIKVFWPSFKRLTAISLPSIIFGPLALLLVRQIIVSNSGWQTTGLFQALLRFFEYPTLLFATFLSLYYLPGLGKSKGSGFSSWSSFTWRAFGILVCLSIGLLVAGAYQQLFMKLLYSDEIVIPSVWYYAFVLNTFFRLWAWVLCLQLLTLEAWRTFFFLELGGALIWVILSALLAPVFEVNGVLAAKTVEVTLVLISLYVLLPRLKAQQG